MLFLIETFLKPIVPDSVFEIPGYVMYRQDRPGVKQGGGILAYVNLKLKENRRIDLEVKEIETWLDIFPFNSKRPLLVGALYRPPSSNVDIDSRIEKNIENAYLLNCETIIVGDFNINYLDHAYNSHRLAKALKNMALSQVIFSVTRPKSGTCLDHCYTSHPAFIANTSVLNIGLADHLPLIIQRKYAKQRRGCESEHTKISYRETKNLNLAELLQSLERIPWDTAFVFEDIDDILNAFESMLNEVLDQHLPWKNRRAKRQNQPPWMDDEIMKLIRQRDNLLETARRTNLSIDWSLYTRAKCKTSHSIKYAKRCFFQDTIDKNKGNLKGIWRALKTLSRVKKHQISIRQLIMENGAVTHRQEIAENMNDVFINIASQITPDSQRVADLDFDDVALYEFVRSKSGNQSFEIPPITEAQMLDLIKKIPSSKAIGCDGLSVKVLKLVASVLVHPLCRLMNFSISSECFPSTWKTTQVTPLFKSGSREDTSNHRPISVLPVLSKILEHHVATSLCKHLHSYDLL